MSISLQKMALKLAVAAAIAWGVPRGMGAETTTRPAAVTRPATAVMRPGPAYVLQRFRTALGQINLTSDEKPKVEAVLAKANERGLDLSQSLTDAQNQDRIQILKGFGQEIRQNLGAVLTDEQMKALDQKLNGAGGQAPGNRTNSIAGVMDHVQEALNQLDLSEDQKQQAKDILAAMQDKLAEIRNGAFAGGNMQQELQQARKELRDKLQAMLTPNQMQAFILSMQQFFQPRSNPVVQPNQAGRPRGEIPENKPLDLQVNGPEAGSPAPDLQVIETNGRAFNPSQYKGHIVVLEFGSMSCPVFRSHAQEMEKLKLQESGRAFFLIVYTREQFPAGEKNVERNRDEGVNIPQAATLDDRKKQALETQRELRLTIPMAVDSMDDAFSNAYGGFPNGAVVIGKDGNIAARQQWTNPGNLQAAIDDAFNAAEKPEH